MASTPAAQTAPIADCAAELDTLVADADGQLTLSPSNQPTYTLRPYRDGMFTIVELTGFRVEFRRGPSGSIDELIFHQPNGTFLAPRVPPQD